ncbi:MAG: precorrin-2 C(20)-methyltransferase [Bacillota bacterium]
MAGKLYGIGVGPGDPDLLTFKAVNILNNVDYIFVPKARDKDSTALKIIEDKVDYQDRLIELSFTMSKDQAKLAESRQQIATEIENKLAAGYNSAFITLGDPGLYSTFIYIKEILENRDQSLEIETVPGITSISCCAAGYNLPLVEAGDDLAILEAGFTKDKFSNILDNFNTVVILKPTTDLNNLLNMIETQDLQAKIILGSRTGFKDQTYIDDIREIRNSDINYLSTLIIKKEGI